MPHDSLSPLALPWHRRHLLWNYYRLNFDWMHFQFLGLPPMAVAAAVTAFDCRFWFDPFVILNCLSDLLLRVEAHFDGALMFYCRFSLEIHGLICFVV